MKFHLVDKIESIEPGKRIVTTKALSLAEEYLADHFPAFPVMPGVLMVETLVQSAAWLTRIAQKFSKSIIVLETARNVRYANFVKPGDLLRCEVNAIEIGDNSARFNGSAFVGDQMTVSAKLDLKCFNLAEKNPAMAKADESIISQLKQRFSIAGGPKALAEAGMQAQTA